MNLKLYGVKKERIIDMGLDNGIMLKRQKPNKFLERIFLEDFKECLDERDKGLWEIEICYWRKCWNVRRYVFDYIIKVDPNDTEELQFPLTARDVWKIRKQVKYWLTHGDEWVDSFWDFEDFKANLEHQYKYLFRLWLWMKFHPKDKTSVYFYDSY